MTDPGDIPTSVTSLIYTNHHDGVGSMSRNQFAEMLSHHWGEIEQHFREKISAEIQEDDGNSWEFAQDTNLIRNGWVDSRDGARAAWIALGKPE